MAFTSGVTTKGIGPDGGLLDIVFNYVTGTNTILAESLGSPDGVEVTFASTLAQASVFPNLTMFKVTYTIGGTTYTAQANAAGVISGDHITTGSIDAAGVYSITFDTAPDNTTGLTARYRYQEVSGVAGRDWVIQLDQNAKNPTKEDTTWGDDTREVVLQNAGLGSQDNVIIGMREWKRPAGDAYGWNLNGYATVPVNNDWNESVAEHGLSVYETTSDNWADLPTLQMFDGIIAYWIYANKQRIIVQIRCASDYYCSYLGLGNRFDPPSEYPNPLIIAGTCCGAKPYANNGCVNYGSGGWSPVRPFEQDDDSTLGPSLEGRSPVMVVQANGQFRTMYNQMRFVPYDGLYGKEYGDTAPVTTAINDNTVIDAAADGSYMMLPAYIIMPDGSEIGFDGIRILRKNNINSEDTRTDSATGDVWRLFQSGSNTAASAWHAIKEE